MDVEVFTYLGFRIGPKCLAVGFYPFLILFTTFGHCVFMGLKPTRGQVG